jgi:type IV secretory pathway VirB10-like protein
MKRCSECDFIYEDEQHLCEMDGHELVYEPTIQALQLSTITKASELPALPDKSRVRHQALAAGVAVVIAILLSVGYSGFTSEYAPQNTKAPATNVISTPLPPADHGPAVPEVSPTPAPSDSPQLEKSRVKPTGASQVDSRTQASRSAASKRETVSTQPAKANHKKESGIGGFLKKTGKILKRPFKF